MALDTDLPQQAELSPPYQPSWIDRLIAKLEQLPISALAVYGGLWVLAGIAHLVVWSGQTAPWRTIDGRNPLVALWTLHGLGFIAYLSRTAGRALHDFRQTLDLDDREFAPSNGV